MTPIAIPKTKSMATSKSQMKILAPASNSLGTGTSPLSFRRKLMRSFAALDHGGQNAFNHFRSHHQTNGGGHAANGSHNGSADDADAETDQKED